MKIFFNVLKVDDIRRYGFLKGYIEDGFEKKYVLICNDIFY